MTSNQNQINSKEIIEALPCKNGLRLYRNFWFRENHLPGIISFRKTFVPHRDDILLMTYPKSGTTWIKALAFAILDRRSRVFSPHNHPLLATHPQDCAPFVEGGVCGPRIQDLTFPRLLSTHLPYSLLPDSMKQHDDECRIVYVCREAKDTFVSMWHFFKDVWEIDRNQLQTSLTNYCEGVWPYGPVWDHQMECRRESLARPEKVMFLNYEEMKERPEEHVRRLAAFVGVPVTEEEEREGVVEGIVRLCSFEFLKGLEVNREGEFYRMGETVLMNSSFFRKGKVGDWNDILSVEMAEMMDKKRLEKMREYGFK